MDYRNKQKSVGVKAGFLAILMTVALIAAGIMEWFGYVLKVKTIWWVIGLLATTATVTGAAILLFHQLIP